MKTPRSKIVIGFAIIMIFAGIYLNRTFEIQIVRKSSSSVTIEPVHFKKHEIKIPGLANEDSKSKLPTDGSEIENRIGINKAGSNSFQNSRLEKLESAKIEKPALTPQDLMEVEEKLNADLSANEELNSIAKLDFVRCYAEGCEFRYISFQESPEKIRNIIGAFFVKHQEFGSTLEHSLLEEDPLVNTFKFHKN